MTPKWIIKQRRKKNEGSYHNHATWSKDKQPRNKWNDRRSHERNSSYTIRKFYGWKIQEQKFKNSSERFRSRMEMKEDSVSSLENRSVKIIQSEQ